MMMLSNEVSVQCAKMAQCYDFHPLIVWSVVRINPQLNFHLEWGESPALCNSRRRNHEMWSHREEGPGHCSISKEFLSVRKSSLDAM